MRFGNEFDWSAQMKGRMCLIEIANDGPGVHARIIQQAQRTSHNNTLCHAC